MKAKLSATRAVQKIKPPHAFMKPKKQYKPKGYAGIERAPVERPPAVYSNETHSETLNKYA